MTRLLPGIFLGLVFLYCLVRLVVVPLVVKARLRLQERRFEARTELKIQIMELEHELLPGPFHEHDQWCRTCYPVSTGNWRDTRPVVPIVLPTCDEHDHPHA